MDTSAKKRNFFEPIGKGYASSDRGVPPVESRIDLYDYAVASIDALKKYVAGGKSSGESKTRAPSTCGTFDHETCITFPIWFKKIPFLAEVSIGHALIADALVHGLNETVRRYLAPSENRAMIYFVHHFVIGRFGQWIASLKRAGLPRETSLDRHVRLQVDHIKPWYWLSLKVRET